MIHNPNGEVRFHHLTTLVRRRWKLIAGAALGGLLLGITVGLVVPSEYTAKAQLLIVSAGGDSVDVIDEAAIDTHVQLLQSPRHIRLVQKSLATGTPPGETITAPVPQPDGGEAAGEMPEQADRASDENEPDQRNIPQSTIDLAFEDIEGNLNIYAERNSRVIAVTFTWTDPEIAAIVANRTARLYVELGRERARIQREKALARLNERIPIARADLHRAEAAVRDYHLSFGGPDISGIEGMGQQIAELKRQFDANMSTLAGRDARLAQLREYQSRADGLPLLVEALGDPRLTRLQHELLVAQSRPASDPAGVEMASDASVSAVASSDTRAQLTKAVADSLDSLERDRDAIEARVQDIRQRLEALERARREALRESELRSRELEQKAAAAAQVYERLLQRQADLYAQDSADPPARIVSAATAPEFPSSPSPILFLLPTVFAAGVVGGLAALVLENLDRRLRSEYDVEALLGVPCIGLLPSIEMADAIAAQRRLIDSPFDPYTEAIRSTVSKALPKLSHKSTICLVTSSQRGEGRTTLAISFAVYAARLRRSTLLVDLDLRKPDLARKLGWPDEDASVDLNDQPADRLVCRLPEFGIDFLPLSKHPIEVLSTDWLSAVLGQMRRRYNCIVIDAAPLCESTEARLFAPHADSVIFAVKWGAVDAEIALGALYKLRHSVTGNLAERVSAVVTQVDLKMHEFCRYHEVGRLSPASARSES
jgi:uncharacterized protein involved in exopolysaccharide biosynthesis